MVVVVVMAGGGTIQATTTEDGANANVDNNKANNARSLVMTVTRTGK